MTKYVKLKSDVERHGLSHGKVYKVIKYDVHGYEGDVRIQLRNDYGVLDYWHINQTLEWCEDPDEPEKYERQFEGEHPHADVIRLYAQGYKIQLWRRQKEDWAGILYPSFSTNERYRAKPLEKSAAQIEKEEIIQQISDLRKRLAELEGK